MRARYLTMTALIMSIVPSGCSSPSGPAARVPVGDPAAISAGRAIYQAHCALCHGVTGDGHGRRHEGFKRPPPDFTSPGWRTQASPVGVLDAVTHGVRGTTMAAWAGTLTARERVQVTAFVLSLAGRDR